MDGVLESFVRIPMADGRVLAAHVWRPVDGQPVPAIIEARPYRGYDLFRPFEEQYLPVWAAAGYAVVALDIAGSGQSTGVLTDEYLPREIDDAVAVVAWCAARDWCDGQVGMSGLSWAAFTALRVCARRPAALKALVLGGVSEDGWRTDIHHLGGALYAARVDWAGVMQMLGALPPDPAEMGAGWKDEWLARLAADRPWIEPWLAHPARDAYWADKAFDLAAPDAPELPLLLYAGWADKYATSVLRIAAAWRGPVRTVIGPWEHTLPDMAERRPRIDFLGEALRWWDHWLKGIDTGVMDAAPLRAWIGEPDREGLSESGRWVGAAWPAEPRAWELAMTGAGRLGAPDEDYDAIIRVAPAPVTPQALTADRYEDAPASIDLSAITGATVLLTDPVTDDIEICGPAVLRCQALADHSGGLLVARLVDIDPAGHAVRMTVGALNLTPETQVVLEFQATAWRLKRGHRLGLVLSADGWPTLWPSLSGAGLEIAARALSLRLPLVEVVGPEPVFSPPPKRARPDVGALKWIDPDQETLPAIELNGAAIYDSQSAAHHLPATGTDYFGASRFALALSDDGQQALAVKISRMAFQRPDWSIRVDMRLAVMSTAEAFEIRWSVRAEHDGALVHEYEGSAQVTRTVV